MKSMFFNVRKHIDVFLILIQTENCYVRVSSHIFYFYKVSELLNYQSFLISCRHDVWKDTKQFWSTMYPWRGMYATLSLYRNVCLWRDDVTLSYIVYQQTDNYKILKIIAVRAAHSRGIRINAMRLHMVPLLFAAHAWRTKRKQGRSSRSLFVRLWLRKSPRASRAMKNALLLILIIKM